MGLCVHVYVPECASVGLGVGVSVLRVDDRIVSYGLEIFKCSDGSERTEGNEKTRYFRTHGRL